MTLRNADALITSVEGELLTGQSLTDVQHATIDNEPAHELTNEAADSDYEQPSEYISQETINKESPQELTTDDYGTEVAKAEKTYTQSEVEAMIRERVARQNRNTPEPAPQIEPVRQENQTDESWEKQLDSYIDNRLTRREQEANEIQWRQKQDRIQADFETKFNSGASKYSDFESVVHGKPLTPQMVLATRGMDNPAAFIYAAAKTQPKELERIARMDDQFAQAVEIGKLEERMRKVKAITSAPKPIGQPTADVSEKYERKWSIDDKLRGDEARLRKLRNAR